MENNSLFLLSFTAGNPALPLSTFPAALWTHDHCAASSHTFLDLSPYAENQHEWTLKKTQKTNQKSKPQHKNPLSFSRISCSFFQGNKTSPAYVNSAGPGSHCSASVCRSAGGLKWPHLNNVYENETTQNFSFPNCPTVIRAPGFSCEACTSFAKGKIGRSSVPAELRHAIAYKSAWATTWHLFSEVKVKEINKKWQKQSWQRCPLLGSNYDNPHQAAKLACKVNYFKNVKMNGKSSLNLNLIVSTGLWAFCLFVFKLCK